MIHFLVALVMAQINQDLDLDQDQDQLQDLDPAQDLIQEHIDQDLEADQDPEVDQISLDLPLDNHILPTSLVQDLTLELEDRIRKKSQTQVRTIRQLVMLVKKVPEVKKVKDFLRLVNENPPQKCSQHSLMIQILKMKKKCQNKNPKRYQKRTRKMT